jgi:predicted TPR repeat methyltransferase
MAGSGDLLADRRYAYADAALADGDHEAAADLARQTIELAPSFPAAWFLLGRAREAQARRAEGSVAADRRREAVAALEKARALDPEDRLGAGVRLALLDVMPPSAAMSAGYVRALFDEYAIRFDRHLTKSLAYRGPDLLHSAVRRACSLRLRDFRFGRALDLGCGTGLAGEVFRAQCDILIGVDLSPAMVRRAEAKRIYDELHVADLVPWLDARPAGEADLALAADVFVYIGDLAPAFRGVARALRPGGLFAFTVQAHGGEGVALGQDHRFAHGRDYLCRELAASGLTTALSEDVVTRKDRDRDVPGLLIVAGC